MDPTVFIVDDDQLVRKSLTQLVGSVGLPVQAFESGEAFLSALSVDCLGCTVLDIRMPVTTGLELQRKMIERKCPMPIIVLTGYGDVPTVIQAFKAGAFDFVQKPFESHRMLNTIQAAIGQAKKNHEQFLMKKKAELRLATLTSAERRVLDLMITGKNYKNIANDLDISYTTVQARSARIMRKMGVENLAELMHLAIVLPNAIAAA